MRDFAGKTALITGGGGFIGGLVTINNGGKLAPTGTLTISNNLTAFLGVVSSGGIIKSGTGTLTLSGSGNTIRGALQATAGTLAFTGTFTTASRISASDSAGNSGTISISGTLTQSGGTFTVRSFQIANNSNNSVGTCNILPGASVTLGGGAMLGDNGTGGVAGGTGTFNQSGGTFNSNGEFWTAGGTSNVNISGGSFTSSRLYIGGGGNSNSASTSTLTVSGGTAQCSTYDISRKQHFKFIRIKRDIFS